MEDIIRDILKVRWCKFKDMTNKTLLSILIIGFVATVFVGYDYIISLFLKIVLGV